MSSIDLEDSNYQQSISSEFVKNILKLVSGEDLYNFLKSEKDQTQFLIKLLSLDEDSELNRHDIFKAIDLLSTKSNVLSLACNDLNIKSLKEFPGIVELKKRIELNDPIFKWKERKNLTKHDWVIKTTDLAFAQINELTFTCELAGSFLNEAINLIDSKEAIEKIEYAKREIYKLLRYFESEARNTDEFLNDELNKPDEPI